MLEILPLALGSALYPTLLAMVVLILRRDDPRRILAAYLAGALVTSLTVGAIVIGALNAGKVVGGSDHTVGPGVDIAGGLLALLLFFVLRTHRDRALRERRLRRKAAKDDKTPLSQRVLERESLVMTFMIGVALSLPGMLYLVVPGSTRYRVVTSLRPEDDRPAGMVGTHDERVPATRGR